MDKTFREYMRNTYEPEELAEIVQHGCVSGVASTLIYYSDTCRVYDQYAEELHEIVSDYMDGLGEIGYVPNSIGENFRSLTQFKNAVVWFAAEIVASDFCNEMEEL